MITEKLFKLFYALCTQKKNSQVRSKPCNTCQPLQKFQLSWYTAASFTAALSETSDVRGTVFSGQDGRMRTMRARPVSTKGHDCGAGAVEEGAWGRPPATAMSEL